jgi:hypothetical protein
LNVVWRRPFRGIRILLWLVIALTGESSAYASLTVLVGEPFGSFGTMMPVGHTAIYMDHLCAEGPLRVRLCQPGEPQGVVLARYHAIGKYDWLASPVLDFLYATQDPAEMPAYATPQNIWDLREHFRERFLRDIVPDGKEGVPAGDGRATGAHDLEEWWEAAGVAYNRRLWAYQLATTPEQDAAMVTAMNSLGNQHHYRLKGSNCANFAADLVNMIFPGAVTHGDRVADFGLMTPKHVARSVTEYAAKHEQLNLRVWEIPQIPGSLRRSRPVRGAAEAGLKTKRYLFTLLLIQPEVPLVLEGLYLEHGRWKVGQGAQPMPGFPNATNDRTTVASTSTAAATGSQ